VRLDDQREQVRLAAEASLNTFINLVHPQRVLGNIHLQLNNWCTRSDAKSHQLVLLPRDHGKSAMAAYRVAWTLTRDPTVRILYISSTANLAIKQLGFIKDILTSDIYRRYWPDMVNVDEGKRKKWTETEIIVDHPLRKAEAVRDPTIFTAGLTTTVTGLHCDFAVLDDVVVYENAYIADGREKVKTQYSFLSSVETANSGEWVYGTRYDPRDLYNDLQKMNVEVYGQDGLEDTQPLFEVFERQVEDIGDGTGQFLWPRQSRYDGREFGFNKEILAKKKAQYLDKTQFRAQYYNDPNDPSTAGISRDLFQYYERRHVSRVAGKWYFKQSRLNLYAAVDFAYSMNKAADYTSIVVLGIDGNRNYYILDIDRFKTTKISEYYQHILNLHRKWDFRWLRAETTAAQKAIVEDIKDNYIRRDGLALVIEDFRPTAKEGSKEERMDAILQPRYANRQIWHYPDGLCQTLEEELVLQHPPHDDIKDALSSAIEIAKPPSASFGNSFLGVTQRPVTADTLYHSRFGGIS
jgi:phage terminase large subunit-like protein